MRHWQVNRHWLPHQASFNQHFNKMFARTLNSNGKKCMLQNVWLIIHWWSQLVLKYQISRANQWVQILQMVWAKRNFLVKSLIWCFTLNENFKVKIFIKTHRKEESLHEDTSENLCKCSFEMKTHQKEENFNTNKGKKIYRNYVGEILRTI